MVGDITSANAKVILTVDELFPQGVTLQMFSADTAYNTDSIPVAVARMGVDGYMAAGQTPNIKQVSITLEACSPSVAPLSTLHKAMDQYRRIYPCKLVISLPSIGQTMTYSDGVLISGTAIPAGGRVLSPTQWVFNFANYEKSGV